MSDLFVLQTALAGAINADSVLCLAHATAWLDPMRGDPDDINMPQDEDDTMLVALHMLRRAFPGIYLDALQAVRRGACYAELDRTICEAVQAQGIPLENLEWLPFGIPLPAYGAALDDPDFYAAHPDVLPVLDCFGVSPEPNPYDIVIPEIVYQAADIIADDLLQQDDDRWRQIGWLLRWVFSVTGNSACDLTLDEMSELQPLSWDADDIAFAREIIEEAEAIMTDVLAGLEWINQNPAALETLSRSVQKVYQKKGSKNARYRFEWPCPAGHDERGAGLVA